MARRSRDRRKHIPGYDEYRPGPDDRRREHRKTRHAANQMLHTLSDPDELVPLPEVRPDHHHDEGWTPAEPEKRRFKVWKTKFWKRRDSYRDIKRDFDARWDEIANPEPEEAW